MISSDLEKCGPTSKLPFKWHFAGGPIVALFYMGLVAPKAVFVVSDKREIQTSLLSYRDELEIPLVASLDMILFKKRIKRR